MRLTKIIPKIFYEDIKDGLHLFVDGLKFKVVYNDAKLYIIIRDDVTIQLLEDAEYAAKDRPEIRIETDDIAAFYKEVKEAHPELLHPNLNIVKQQPWGLKEFALLDKTTVCVIIQQQ